MSQHFSRQLIADQALVREDIRQPMVVDRSFELPKVLYGVTVALYLGFLAVMAVGLQSPGLIIPMAIFTIFIVMGFAVPATWARMQPPNPVKQMSWRDLSQRGIATATGRVKAGDAAVQMLILPVLIFCWAIAAVTIAALV